MLDRAPDNSFADVEQAALNPGNFVLPTLPRT